MPFMHSCDDGLWLPPTLESECLSLCHFSFVLYFASLWFFTLFLFHSLIIRLSSSVLRCFETLASHTIMDTSCIFYYIYFRVACHLRQCKYPLLWFAVIFAYNVIKAYLIPHHSLFKALDFVCLFDSKSLLYYENTIQYALELKPSYSFIESSCKNDCACPLHFFPNWCPVQARAGRIVNTLTVTRHFNERPVHGIIYLFYILQHGLFMKHNICKENQCFGSVSVRCSECKITTEWRFW